MAAVILNPGPASALLLLVALAACAGAYDVTIPRCSATSSGKAVRTLPTDYKATALYTQGCHMTEVNSGDFEGLPNLLTIGIDYNDIAHIDTVVFRAVPKLEHLDLCVNKLHEVPVFTEGSCPSLVRLDIASNLITSISNSKTFAACSKLQHLSLSINRIAYLHPNVFSPLTELKELFLGGNKLTFIPTQMFLSNRKLEWLSVDENQLTYLPSDFLVAIGANLKNFYFGGNPWKCACLLELLAEVKRVGVVSYKKNRYNDMVHFDGTHPQCGFIRHPCHRGPLSLLPPVRK